MNISSKYEMADTSDNEIQLNYRDEGRDEDDNGQEVGLEEEFRDANDNHGRGEADDLGMYEMRRGKTGLPVKPDTYDGTSDWEEYLSHFELCAQLGRWPEHEKTLALAASLRGPARTFYISLTSRAKRTYEGLARELGHRFGSTRQQNRWLSRFESRTRQSGESIAALGDDLRQMSQKAYPNLDNVAQEALALNQLYKSISLEMKCRCIDRNCSTIAQAVDIIERYEAVLGDVGDKKKATRMVTSSGQQNELKEALDKLNQRLQMLEDRSHDERNGRNQWRSGQNYGTRTCFVCHSPDHFMRDCPHARQRPTQNNAGRRTEYNQGNGKPSSK